MYYGLIDDLVFEEFINNPQANFSNYQKSQAIAFANEYEQYYDSLPYGIDPRKVIDDPKWNEISTQADKLIDILDLRKYANK